MMEEDDTGKYCPEILPKSVREERATKTMVENS